MKKTTPTISLIIPIYNEESNLPNLFSTLNAQLKESAFNYEYILVNDGSTDNTSQIIKELDLQHPLLSISFSRNFGKEAAIFAGLEHCKGDAAVILDADLQHPIDLIPEFIKKWQSGYDMVYGLLQNRHHQNFLKKGLSKLFYKILDLLSEIKIPANAGDFRLLNRKVINSILKCSEKNQFMKGLYSWVGFKSYAIPYQANERQSSNTRWSYAKLFRLAIQGLTSFSNLPLRLATIFGLTTSFVAFFYGVWILTSTILNGISTPGFATTIVVILFLGGAQLTCIGIVGEYIAKIFTEVKGRPHYIVSDTELRKNNKEE